ncbi:MAG: histidine kinase [Flavobacteriales bacterium]|nr:histidine kinase [Flavobacteriales bacterium]
MTKAVHLFALLCLFPAPESSAAQGPDAGQLTAFPLSVGGMRTPLDILVDAHGYAWLLDERSVFCLVDGDPERFWTAGDERHLTGFIGADEQGIHIATDAGPVTVPIADAAITPVHLANPADPKHLQLPDGTTVQLADSGWLSLRGMDSERHLDLSQEQHTNLFQFIPGDQGRVVYDPSNGIWVLGSNGLVLVSLERPLFEVYDVPEGLGKVTQVVDDTAADRRFVLSGDHGLVVQRITTGKVVRWIHADADGAPIHGNKWRAWNGAPYFQGARAVYRYDTATDRVEKVLDLDKVLADRTRDRRINDFEIDPDQGLAFIGTKDNVLVTFDLRTGRTAVRDVKPEGTFSGIDLILETALFGQDQGLVFAEHGQFIADGLDGPVRPAQERWPSFRFGPNFRAAGGHVVADTLVVIAGFADGIFLYNIPRDSLYRPTGMDTDRLLMSDVFWDGLQHVYGMCREGLLVLDLRQGDVTILNGEDGLPLDNLYYRYMSVSAPGELVLGLTDRYARFRTRDLLRKDASGLFIENFSVNGQPVAGAPYQPFGSTWRTDHAHNSVGLRIGRAQRTTPPFTCGFVRLDGLPGSVRFVDDTDPILFQALSTGDHRIELGFSRHGPFTTLLQVDVLPPFWSTWWFYLLGAAVVIGIVTGFMWLRFRAVRAQAELKAAYDLRITQLELRSLRAQMHPHFLFNSLNSIKSFIAANESRTATRYLNKFAQLVRSILNNSSKPLVELSSELQALKLYLELEQMRFEKKFNAEVTVDPRIDPEQVRIPPLIMQPYAENAIWHGLMHKKGDRALHIRVAPEGDDLLITIRDNGIGREAARALRSRSASPHRSLGMTITAEVIQRTRTDGRSGVEVVDLYDAQGSAAGTEVRIRIPLDR